MARRGDTRARMVRSAIGLMQRNGAAAVTVDAVLADSDTPRGSVYHHFPGGRDQLVGDALRSAGDLMTSMIRESVDKPIPEAIDTFLEFWRHLLTTSDYRAGCPIAGAAVGGAESDPALHDQVAAIFAEWHVIIRDALVAAGAPAARAQSVAIMLVAATEGALILARVERSLTPLDDVADEIRHVIDSLDLTA
ncbi:TetR/AcrR family transcriptional regulator [Williamsia herbipolensis]|uniref:TetR/AcrR family transcriptional regulator n=1 Tax=Williamsia herbipolensis TaxID=1603258 RepID=UPI0005F88D01|nr:TetR/AcrR family transcriptional regulator [Williamsia herbipolensis]